MLIILMALITMFWGRKMFSDWCDAFSFQLCSCRFPVSSPMQDSYHRWYLILMDLTKCTLSNLSLLQSSCSIVAANNISRAKSNSLVFCFTSFEVNCVCFDRENKYMWSAQTILVFAWTFEITASVRTLCCALYCFHCDIVLDEIWWWSGVVSLVLQER